MIARTALEAPGVDFRGVDTSGEAISWDGETAGEIIVRDDNLMKGYWKVQEESGK